MSGSSPPVNVDVPLVTQSGGVLNCTMGNWDGEPTSYAYAWTSDGINVAGVTGPDYNVQPVDVGTTFACVVTATNAGGSTDAPVSNGVIVGEPPVEVGPAPPTQEQIERAFEIVRAQNWFKDVRASSIASCEEVIGKLEALLPLCHEPFEDHVAEVTAGLDEATGLIADLRGTLADIQLPELPAPPDLTGPYSQTEIDRAARLVKSYGMVEDLFARSVGQCDIITTTLSIAAQWGSEPDAVDHLTEMTNGVHGGIEQVARLRSTIGSTQT